MKKIKHLIEMSIGSSIKVAALSAMLALGAAPTAAQQDLGPAEVVRKVTSEVLEVVQDHRDSYDQNPQAYFQAIDEVVTPYINFERMAFLVMDAKYYRASSEAQRSRFVKTFHDSLVMTYSKGLLSVDRAEFNILPVEVPAGSRTVTVKQELRAGANEFDLAYSMRREDDGRWLLVNVIIDGINLGNTFRNQFAQSAIKYNEDLDQVIANWSADTE